MNSFSNNTKKTSVKIFVNTFALFSFLNSQMALAINATAPNYTLSDEQYQNMQKQEDCKKAKDDLARAQEESGKLCSSAGFGKDCKEKLETCAETSSSESFNTIGALATAAGVTSTLGGVLNQLGQQQQQSNSTGCPQYTADGYRTDKKQYTDNLEKAEEDLAKLTDDRADAEEDFNKEINDLQDELNKAQEDLDKTKLEIADKKRKQLQDFQSTQASAKEELRKKGTEVLQLQGKLITSQRDKALKLIAMTDASGTRACKKAVNDAKKDMTSSTSLNSSNMISKAKANKQALIDTYNDCMDAFQQQRVALLESKKQEQEELNKAIADTNEDMASIQDSLSTAQSQLTEMQNDAATEQSNAEQKLVKIMQNTQNKMTAAKQKLQTKLQTIAQKTQTYTEKINRANNGLAQMGPKPSGKATSTASDIAGEFDAVAEKIEIAKKAYKTSCNIPASSSSSGRSSKGISESN